MNHLEAHTSQYMLFPKGFVDISTLDENIRLILMLIIWD